MQKDGLGFPVYKEVTAIGQDHSKEFITQVDLVLCAESLVILDRERKDRVVFNNFKECFWFIALFNLILIIN